MKYALLSLLMACSGMAMAQPYPFLGYTIYDYLVTATHPNGCPPEYVTGLPDDSIWVNMLDYTVMTGYFGNEWKDLPGNDLLLEAAFHRHNYIVRLILEGGTYSAPHTVDLADWSYYPNITWKHIFPGCIEGSAVSPRLMLALDFVLFGISPDDVVIGIEITFLPTPGLADFAGAYIIVPPCGLFSLGPDTTICPQETVTLDATTTNASYLWQDGSAAPVYTNAGPGVYWVKITIYDCSKTDTIRVIAKPGPPDLGDDFVLCTGESQVLDVTAPGATYEWQDHSTQSTFTVSQAGTYAVTVTIDDCIYTDAIMVTQVDFPVIDLGNDTTLCDGFELLLNVSTPNATYDWQDQSTDSILIITAPGQYAVTVDVSGCISQDIIQVDYVYPEQVYLGQNEILCEGETLFLDAYIPGATYLWQDQSTLSDYTITEGGSYWVVAEKDNCTTSDTILVEITPEIILDLGNDTTLCAGESLTLDVTQTGASYSWQDQSTSSAITVTATGDYFVTLQIGDCTASDTIHVSFIVAPNIQLGPDTTLCGGQSLQLNAAAPGAIFDWQDHSTAPTFVVTQPGQYWVNATLNGCTATDTIRIAYVTLSSLDLGLDSTLCDEETLLLDAAQPGASYIWQDNSTSPTFTVTQSGTYQVTVSIGHCSTSDTMLVSYNHVPPIMLGSDTTLCEGELLLLEVTAPGTTLLWQNQSTASSFLVNTPGSYWVSARNGRCSISDTIVVNYISLASIELGADTTLCDGQTLTLDAGIPGANYLWSDNSTNQTIQINQAGTYWVQASLGNCVVADTIHIHYQSYPVVALGNDTLLCESEVLALDASNNNASYTWQDHSMGPTFIVSQPGSYYVTAGIGHCEANDTIEVSYQSIPDIELGNDTTLCTGAQLILHANFPGATYEWQDHSTQPDILVTASGEYFVRVRTGVCEATDTIHIAYLQLSSVSLGEDTTLCDGESLILQVNVPGAQYEWQDQSTAQTFEVSQPGTYWVKVSLAECATADTIVVAYTLPVHIYLGPDTILCGGETLLLNAQTTGAAYEWQDHSVQSTYNVTQSGSYHVALDVDGCMTADTLEVTYAVLPEDILGQDTSLCDGTTIVLDATHAGVEYLWQDLSTYPTVLVTMPGTYEVTLTIDHCTASDSIEIYYETPVSVDLGDDRSMCEGEMITLDPHLEEEVEYLWQDNSTSSTYVVAQPGLYWLRAKDACGFDSDSVLITQEQCSCHLYMNNVFSPNGDGINDVLIPQATCGFVAYHLTVFDRYGGLLFETSEPGEGWDGIAKSKTVQSGVYVYVLTYAFEADETKQLYGDVTLLR